MLRMVRVATGDGQQKSRMTIDYQGIVAHGLAIQIASKIREALKSYMRDLRRQYARAQLAGASAGKTRGAVRRA